MKIIYIAGPYRAKTSWGIAENIRSAERVGLEVARLGAMPLIPHANTAHYHGELTDEFWLDGTLELLRRCDGIVMAPHWEQSTGALSEREEAERLHLSVFADQNYAVSLDGLARWLHDDPAADEPFDLTEDERTRLSFMAPNLLSLLEHDPPATIDLAEETRQRAREELVGILRMKRRA